jgi:WD40 repeat protein
VQFWDVANRKELRRIDIPPGYRASAEFALLTADWKTLYLSVSGKRSIKSIERDGKKVQHIEDIGEVRVCDVASGKEKPPLQPPPGSAFGLARLAPGGRYLVCSEQPGYDLPGPQPKTVMVAWDLAAIKKRKLCDGWGVPVFGSNHTAVLLSLRDPETKASLVRLFDLPTGKELARLDSPEKDRYISASTVSPDGAVVAIQIGGKRGAPLETLFRDARTLADRGKLVGKGHPDWPGWAFGQFTSDGKRYISLDWTGNALVWDVAGQKLECTVSLGDAQPSRQLAISPDAKTLAVGWMPKPDAELANVLEPDPQDLPQPRVSLIDLAGKAQPRVLVAPHGYAGPLAFSPDGKLLAFGSSGAVHLFDLSK